MKIRTLITCLLLFICIRLAGQDIGEINGQLIDSLSGEPLEYATVALFKQGMDQPVDGRVTNESGHFSFSALELAHYRVMASFLGYTTKIVDDIRLTSAKPRRNVRQILLNPDAAELGEVTIQALRPTIVQKADRIVVNIAGTALATGNSAYELLARAPGVFVSGREHSA